MRTSPATQLPTANFSVNSMSSFDSSVNRALPSCKPSFRMPSTMESLSAQVYGRDQGDEGVLRENLGTEWGLSSHSARADGVPSRSYFEVRCRRGKRNSREPPFTTPLSYRCGRDRCHRGYVRSTGRFS